MKKIALIIIFTLSITFGVIGYTVLNNRKSDDEVEIKTAVVKKDDIKISFVADGSYNIPMYELSFKQSGELSEIYASEGDYVKNGDIIAKIFNTDLYNDYLNAKKDYEEVLMKEEQNIASSKIDVRAKEAEVNIAKSEYEITKKEYEDILELKDLYSENELEEKYKIMIQKKADYDKKLSEKNLIKNYSEELSNIAINKSLLKLKTIKSKIDDMMLKSFVSGEVYEVYKIVGEDVTSSDEIVKIAAIDESKIIAEVSEVDIDNIEIGQKVEVEFDAIVGKIYKGEVTLIRKDPIASNNGIVNFEVEIKLDEKNIELKNSMTAVIEFILVKRENVITIPNKAVYIENKKQVVEVLKEGNTIEKREIVTGLTDGVSAEVIKGLNLNEKVILKK